MKARAAYLLVLAISTVVAYANSFSGVFLFDDVVRIVEEPRIRSLKPLSALLGGERPVVDFSLAVNYAIGWLNPSGYHLFNLIVHVLAGWTLFGVVRRTILLATSGADTMTTPLSPPLVRGEAPLLIPFAVALIFLVHPLQTQSVTYIIQRGESLMGLFYLLTMYCAIRAIDSPQRWAWSLLALAACALGMGTKGVMITAPLMVMIYDWVFLAPHNDSRSWFATIRSRVPLYVGLCATWVLLWWVGIAGEVLGGGSSTSHVGFSYQGHSAWEYALTQPGVIVQYLRLTFWPAGQVLDYDWPIAEGFARIVLPGLVVLIFLGATVWLLKQRHWLGFLGAWFFLILAPTSSIVPIKDIMFEHRMYLPLAAVISAIVVPLGVWIMSRTGSSNGATAASAGQSRAAIGFAALVVLLGAPLAYATHLRNRVYHSELTMWQDVVDKRPGNARGYVAIGNKLAEVQEYQEALDTTIKATQVKPEFADGHAAVGILLAKQRRHEEAIPWYQTAVKLQPSHSRAWYNLANALDKTGQFNEAGHAYAKSIGINPKFVDAYCNWGNTLMSQNRIDEGIQKYRQAVMIDPSHAIALNNLGDALMMGPANQEQTAEAKNSFERALEVRPNYHKARLNLASLLRRTGEFDRAMDECRIVLKMDPQNQDAQTLLAAIEAEVNR